MASPSLFEGICEGLQEAIAYERGELEAGSVRLVRFNPDISKCQPLSVRDFFNIACVGTRCYNIRGSETMQIEYTKTAIKVLQRMDKTLRQRILAAIEGLAQIPPKGDIKPMQGTPAGRFRLRVGSYRVIYTYRQDKPIQVLCVLDIGARGDIYK